MSTIGTKLKQILSERGLTATELSRLADVRVSFIYDVLSGKSKNPSIITLSKLANTLAIPLTELSGNESQPVGSGNSSKLSRNYVAISELHADGSKASKHEESDPYLFRKNWVRDSLTTQPEKLRLLHVTGDSMEPTLHHGDVVLVDIGKTTPTPPGIFVLNDGYGLVVKRIDMLPGNEPATLSIKSDNPQYSPYERPLSETRIIGRVVWFAREL